jgi:HSP20 family protein
VPTWDPFREFVRFERDLRRMFDEFWGERRRREALPGPTKTGFPIEQREALVGTPAIDLIDKKDSLILRSEMPGVKKENLKVSVNENSISISGKIEQERKTKEEDYYFCERGCSSWQRTLSLPVKVKPEKAKANYKDGLLEITLPKTEEAKAKAKEIKIE